MRRRPKRRGTIEGKKPKKDKELKEKAGGDERKKEADRKLEALRIEAKSKEEEQLKEEAKKEKELKEKAEDERKKEEDRKLEALRIEAKSKEEERLKEEAKKEKELKEKADEDKKKKEEEERLKEEARKAEQLKRESELADTKVPEGKGQGKGTQQPEEGTEAYNAKLEKRTQEAHARYMRYYRNIRRSPLRKLSLGLFVLDLFSSSCGKIDLLAITKTKIRPKNCA